MSITRACLLAVLGALAAAAPSGAVVGGEPFAPESVPWFADVGRCGGMLVAPDRVLTAVLQAAETTPQVRRRIRWPTWRSFDMTLSLIHI